jgi:hypothetical protein
MYSFPSWNRSLRSVVCLLGAAIVLPAADGPWQSLFDGRTTAGWQEVTGKAFPTACWRIEDGCLMAFVAPGGAQDIRTVDTYRSFDLEFEWKIGPKGNSGVKYLLQKVDEWTNPKGRQARARGLEYQLADDANEEVNDPTRAAASLYSQIAPSPRVKPAIGEFNRSRIVVRGTHVEHWLNGKKVVEFETGGAAAQALFRGLLPKGGAPQFPAGSPISLQNHGTEAWFRNIRIRQLD